MRENRMKAVLESLAQRDVPASVNLWPRIAQRVERKNFMQTVRTRPALALFLVLLALALLSTVAYAIGKVTGYIPGVGIVDQSTPLRILAEPVVVERDGLTVTVSQVVTDSNRTFVAYVVDGILIPSGGKPPICHARPFLQLPDGSALSLLSGGVSGFGGQVGTTVRFETTVSYPPIPASVDNVTLNFPCILPEGTGPENWQIALELSPAPAGYATPAVEIGATFVASNPQFATTPTPASDVIFTPEPSDPSFPATPTFVPYGSGLYLERVIELADSYILVGNFTDAGDLPGGLQVSGDPYDYLPHIEDERGNPVAFEVCDDIQPEVTWGGVHYWAYEIAKPVHGPLTITLDQIDISVSDTMQFKFDTGPTPKIGQKWELNLPIHLRTYDYVLDSVEMIEDGYTFRLHSVVDVPWQTSFSFDIVGSSQKRGPASAQEDSRDKTRVKYTETITYLVPPPTGPLTVELTLFESIPLQGPWTLTWTPPNQ